MSKHYDVVICSGYFNPLHIGHIEYLMKADLIGAQVTVIINNDEQVKKKGAKPFMSLIDRMVIVKALRSVDYIFLSIDKDTTVCQSIRMIADQNIGKSICFAKGGDRFSSEIPEAKICAELGIDIVDGLGEKIRSSSEILKRLE